MKTSDAAQAAARLALVNEKANTAFDTMIQKWFVAQFVRGMKLPLLRSIYNSGVFPHFSDLTELATDADLLTILAKVDKHNSDIQMQSRAAMIAHIEALAAGGIEPAPNPKPKRRTRTKAAVQKKPERPVGIISNNKY